MSSQGVSFVHLPPPPPPPPLPKIYVELVEKIKSVNVLRQISAKYIVFVVRGIEFWLKLELEPIYWLPLNPPLKKKKKKEFKENPRTTVTSVVFHLSTLDPIDRFNVSANPYDTVLSLVPGLPGVWVSVRGSSVLELWDPTNLSCKMLYDTRSGRYPNLRKVSSGEEGVGGGEGEGRKFQLILRQS